MNIFLTFVIGILFGLICAHYAKQRGRNPRNWFFVGLLLGVFGLILVFLLPKKTVDKPFVTALIEPIPEKLQKLWYYLDTENQQFGPMSFIALKRAKEEGKIGAQSYVWNEEMENWEKYAEKIEPLLR